MISETAYVWVFLPGRPEPVVCAVVAWNGVEHVFRYAKSYLARPEAIALSIPGRPLGELTGEPQVLDDELSGALRDAAPDAWGRRLIQRAVARNREVLEQPDNRIEGELGEIDYLLGAGSERIGALDVSESPEEYRPRCSRTSSLEDALLAVQKVERGEELDEALDAALNHGTSIGGARPKVLFRQDHDDWVAKFSSSRDTVDIIAAEQGAMSMAAKAGLRVAKVRQTKVLNKSVLLVRRFDRERLPSGDVARRHMLTAMTLLGLDEYAVRTGEASYLELADLLRKYAANFRRDGPELYLRMVFNILIGNTDDHARNHACFWDGVRLELTPAYDLCPQPRLGYSADLAMVVGDEGRAARLRNALSQPERFGMARDEAEEQVDAMRRFVEASWKDEFASAGMGDADIRYLSAATILSPSVFD